jgi:hypothetical protein
VPGVAAVLAGEDYCLTTQTLRFAVTSAWSFTGTV